MILFFVLSLFTNYLVPIARIVAAFIVTRITPGAFISLRSILSSLSVSFASGAHIATHVLLPHFVIPYQHIPLIDTLHILRHLQSGLHFFDLLLRYPSIDVREFRRISSRYQRFWMQRLLSVPLSLFDDLFQIVSSCLDVFHLQFMQIHRYANSLFVLPT